MDNVSDNISAGLNSLSAALDCWKTAVDCLDQGFDRAAYKYLKEGVLDLERTSHYVEIARSNLVVELVETGADLHYEYQANV